MVSALDVEKQLKRIGVSFFLWGRAEMRELPKILLKNEQIKGCINGRYDGGFAMLCATDLRLLLIDKKPLFLTMTDLRYDMISEVDYGYRLLDASIQVCTPSKNFAFQTWRQKELRDIALYVQQRVVELRSQQYQQVDTANQPQAFAQQTLLNQPTADDQTASIGLQPAQATSTDTNLIQQIPNLQRRYNTNPYAHPPMTSRSRVAKFGNFLMR